MLRTYTEEIINILRGTSGGGVVISPALPVASTSGYTWKYKSSALEKSGVARNAPALLSQAFGYINSTETTGTYYFQIYDSATVPADGATAVFEVAFDHTNGITTSPINLDVIQGKYYFTNGISWAISSTAFTKTLTTNSKANFTLLGY